MKRKTLLVDMDQVLCNFIKASEAAKLREPWLMYPQSQYGFWINLEPIQGGVETVKELMEDFDVYILTRPSYYNPLCYTEKRVWIEKYFGLEFCKNIIMCYDKSMVIGDYLVDDFDHEGFRGEQIKFGSDKFPTWAEVKKYLLGKLKEPVYL